MTRQMKILPSDRADVTAYMRMLFLRTEQEIINVINRKRSVGYVDYAEVAALERVQKILQSMIDQSWAYVPTMIEKIFYHSDKDASGYSNARKMTETFSAPRIAIIQQLIICWVSSQRPQKQLMRAYGRSTRLRDWRLIPSGKQHLNRYCARRQQELHGSTAVRPWYRRCRIRGLLLLWIRRGESGLCRAMGTWLSAQQPVRPRWQPFLRLTITICGRS